jgi:UDP-N-acetylmuramoyl-tripeptide--D-alanyl-D-alanine ligase
MWDYDYLQQMSKGISTIIKYGTAETDLTGTAADTAPFLSVKMMKGFTSSIIKTQLVGEYNLPNVLAAEAVGKYFGVTEEKIISAIKNYTPSNSRSQLLLKNSNTFILDAYNANPSSMKLAIENFAKSKSNDKVLILGAMAELGYKSLYEHELIIKLIKKYAWKNVVLVGGDFLKINHPFISFENSAQANEWFIKENFTHTRFLIKGSRSMKMEKLIE